MATRQVERLINPQPVIEGAGVKLRRSIATRTVDYLDPFLLFDHFGSDDPDDYLPGFPMHPHRGIETVTYMLAGAVTHRDSIGNAGTLGAGDVQWMTSGRGIMHEEMPEPVDGQMWGFQLWVNLPARLKMTAPRYQEVRSDGIPELTRADGTRIRIIAGAVDGIVGAVTEIAADPVYLDVDIPPHTSTSLPCSAGHTAFAYVFEGAGVIGSTSVKNTSMAVLADGDTVEVKTEDSSVRFLLVSGKPLNEPIARYGPFVMNTRAEIEQALRDLREGTFVTT